MKHVSLVGDILVSWINRLAVACIIVAAAVPVRAESPQPAADLTRLPLAALISQSEELGLPTKFLRELPPDFVTVTFEDLHRWGAEYHPEEHHMILNRALSFNQAAGSLRPLTKMTTSEVGNLYHELYHAYMDYLETKPPDPSTDGGRLLAATQELQKCRYAEVKITPVLQRRTSTEVRYLSEREAWETQHETWARVDCVARQARSCHRGMAETLEEGRPRQHSRRLLRTGRSKRAQARAETLPRAGLPHFAPGNSHDYGPAVWRTVRRS
jgi:hypothetical protein